MMFSPMAILRRLRDPVIQNVLRLGAMFFCIFFAFNVTQTFESKINGDKGVAALGVLYMSFAIASLFSTWIIDKLGGARRALLYAMFTFFIFLLANLYPVLGLLIPVSILLGIGASVLWTAHGAYLSAHGDSSTFGLYSGIFFAIFMAHLVLGNLFAAVFFALAPVSNDPDDKTTERTFVGVLSVVCLLSIAFWWFLKDTSQLKAHGAAGAGAAAAAGAGGATGVDDDEADDAPLVGGADADAVPSKEAILERADSSSTPAAASATPTRASTKDRLLATVRVIRDRRMQFLLPVLIFSGSTQAFFYILAPGRVAEKDQVGYVMVVYGIGEVVISLVAGPLGDKFGRGPLIIASLVLAIIGAIGAIFYPQVPGGWLPYVCAFLFGASDTISNTQLYGALPEMTTDADAGFAFWKLFQTLLLSIFLFMSLGVPFEAIAGIFIALALIAMVSTVVLYKYIVVKGNKSTTTTATTLA